MDIIVSKDVPMVVKANVSQIVRGNALLDVSMVVKEVVNAIVAVAVETVVWVRAWALVASDALDLV